MRTFKEYTIYEANISRTDGEPKSPDEKRFKDKHVVQVTDYPVAGTSDVLNAKTMKKDMSKAAGYHETEDEDVYESVEADGDLTEGSAENFNERELSAAELRSREKYAQDLPDADFKKRYGKNWKSVKMATATKMAKAKSEQTNEALDKGYRPNSNYEGPPSIGDIMKSAKPGKVGRLKEVPLADRHKHNINHYAVVHNGERQSSHMFAGAHEKAQKAADDYRAKLAKQGKPTSGVTVHAYASEEVGVSEETNLDEISTATLNRYYHKATVSKKDRTAGINRAREIQRKRLYKAQDERKPYDTYRGEEVQAQEGAFSRMDVQKKETERLGANKVKGDGMKTYKPASTLIANPKTQQVRRVTPSRAAFAVKKGFVYAEHFEGLNEDPYKGQPVGVTVTMKHKTTGQKQKTSFPGTHSAVAGAKAHIAQMQKKGYEVHSKDLMYAEDKQPVDEVSVNKLSQYMSKSAANVSGKDAKTQDKRIAGQSMADKKIRKAGGYSSTAKVAATNEAVSYDDAKKKLERMKKGSTVSFTHSETGKKISGQYHGLRNMGGRSYAYVETGKSAFRVPVHHIHQVGEQVTEARRAKDSVEAENIIMMLRKAVSLKGQKEIVFADGKKLKVPAIQAAKALKTYEDLRTSGEKRNYMMKLLASPESFRKALTDSNPGAAPSKIGITLPKIKALGEQVEVLEEGVIDTLNSIVKNKQVQEVKFKDGKKLKVDMQTANLLTKVYKALNSTNAKKFADKLEQGQSSFMKMLDFAYSVTR